MSIYVDYLNHTITPPTIYQRRFEHDLPDESVESTNWQSEATRVALIALPFLSLYQPLGFAISLVMGSCRTCTHLNGAWAAGQESEWGYLFLEMTQTALAVLALASTAFSFVLGLLVTTAIDTLMSAIHLGQHLYKGEYEKAGEELLQCLCSALYLAIMIHGALEITLAVILIQGVISLYQARREFAQGHYLEAIAKILMCGVRLYQAKNCVQTIQRRDELLSDQKCYQLSQRALKGRAARHLLSSSLANLNEQIEERKVMLSDAEGKEYNFGSHFHGFGKGLVKGSNLAFRIKTKEGENFTELDFKVNHVFREKIQNLINELYAMSPQEIQETLSHSNSHVSDIKVKLDNFPVGSCGIGPAYKIKLEGLGTVFIGVSPYYPTLYDRVVVRMDQNKNLFDLHEMLSFMDLDEALHVSTSEDISRLKMGHLFRTFYPREATPFERTEDFFSLPTDELKSEMIRLAPEMEKLFDVYLDSMEEREILPGRIRYGISGLAQEARDLGARALTAAVCGYDLSESEYYDRVVSMLKMGMISSELRFTSGVDAEGLNSFNDFGTGGSDSVFTQLIAEKSIREEMPLRDCLAYHNSVQMLISPEALETGTYQYHDDSNGVRLMDGNRYKNFYSTRPGIREFIQKQQSNPSFYDWNEVMIKERIPPSLFQGIIVPNEQVYSDLLDHLRMRDIVSVDVNGSETILNMPVNHFIRVGEIASVELLDSQRSEAL